MQLLPEYPTDNASATPGACFRCRSHERHGHDVLRTELVIQDETGEVYFCRQCLAEAAALFGFLTPEQAEALQVKMEELRNSNRAYGRQVKALLSELDAQRELREIAEERLTK